MCLFCVRWLKALMRMQTKSTPGGPAVLSARLKWPPTHRTGECIYGSSTQQYKHVRAQLRVSWAVSHAGCCWKFPDHSVQRTAGGQRQSLGEAPWESDMLAENLSGVEEENQNNWTDGKYWRSEQLLFTKNPNNYFMAQIATKMIITVLLFIDMNYC